MWKELFINNKNGSTLFVDHYYYSDNAPNIIYIQTPVTSVIEYKMCYEPLAKYGYNIFALDLSGIGKSGGNINEFSIKTMEFDIDACIDYIRDNFSNRIHIYGGSGTGGALAQFYVSHKNCIASFAQYGVAIHNDLSHMGISAGLIKILYPFLKLIQKISPDASFKLSLPKYTGKNAQLENQYYENFMKSHPDIFNMKISLLLSYLRMFLEKDSCIQNSIKCPTLVFEALHDRYYPAKYYRNYYNSLTCEKKLYSIDDVHSSFVFHAEEVCSVVADWFSQHTEINI
ncbi:alpha/beta fold hydrolase [Tepidibacter mesophilus]|uniref:alpha/beta fold hydrolase n=1 Tax=Tepidibacter mesophilus TaxID=655607 RepID=UPI000C0819B7|nr:alpha/beta hydrolase [Tepidibacter mesophilus]